MHQTQSLITKKPKEGCTTQANKAKDNALFLRVQWWGNVNFASEDIYINTDLRSRKEEQNEQTSEISKVIWLRGKG